MSLRPLNLVRHQWITSSLGLRGPVGTQAVVTGPLWGKLFVSERIQIMVTARATPFGSSAGAKPSSQVVPRFKSANITRTR